MGLYKIEWKQSVIKELKNLNKPIIPKIINSVEALSDNPFPNGSRKLRAAQFTNRIRVGQYRIIYSVLEKVLTIEIVRIGHRKGIYRKRD